MTHRRILAALALLGALAGCGFGGSAGGPPIHSSSLVIASVTLTPVDGSFAPVTWDRAAGAWSGPAPIAPGDAVLLDYGLVEVPRGWGEPPWDHGQSALMTATGGEALPLLGGAYHPGGTLPTPAQARAILDSAYPPPRQTIPVEAGLRDNDHIYVLWVAPLAPGTHSVFLDTDARADFPQGAPWTVELAVQ